MNWILLIGGSLGLAFGGLMMFIALDHDPQGAVSSDFGWLMTIGLSWAIPIWGITLIVFGIKKLLDRRKR